MSQVSANPWYFTSSDQATTAALTSIANKGASALVTTGTSHGLSVGDPVSIQGSDVAGWDGPYRVQTVPSATTFRINTQPKQFSLADGTNVGNIYSMAYIGGNVRAEQILWNPSAAGQTLLLTDGYGNIIWNPSSGSAADYAPFTYGKVFWFQNGLVINTLTATGTVQMTVN